MGSLKTTQQLRTTPTPTYLAGFVYLFRRAAGGRLAQVDGSGQRAEFMTKKDAVVTDEPLVVWVDGGSASSSEVMVFVLLLLWHLFPSRLFCDLRQVDQTSNVWGCRDWGARKCQKKGAGPSVKQRCSPVPPLFIVYTSSNHNLSFVLRVPPEEG